MFMCDFVYWVLEFVFFVLMYRIMWIQTLPNVVQARVLSFLAYDYKRFCALDLSRLAKNLLSDVEGLDFWVQRGARHLLDVVSDSSYEWVSCLSLDSEGENVDGDFESLPDWLKEASSDGDGDSVLPWLPVSFDELSVRTPVCASGVIEDSLSENEHVEDEDLVNVGIDVDFVHPNNGPQPIDDEIEEMAATLKSQILEFESTSKTVELADNIQELCKRGGDSLKVLGLVEPWKAEDEKASIMITHFSNKSYEELGWPSHTLCSIVLPKLLVLNEPASRVLVSATIEYCKLHQKSAVYALLYPLILRKEGINNPISDVIGRVIRECLHPAHVSAFCQKLLCGEENARKFICLPCHRSLISDELVWNEPLFNLFQIILNHNVHLTEDSVDKLVHRVRELADRFTKSLKFGNFLLCLVSKCTPLLRSHKLSLIEAVEHTNTLVTKSLLSKLSSL